MKKIFWLFAALALVPFLIPAEARTSRPASPTNRQPQFAAAPYLEGEVLVKFKPGKINLADRNNLGTVAALTRAQGVREISRLPALNTVLIGSAAKSTAELVKLFKLNPAVEYAEPNYIYGIALTPNDTNYGNLWGLHNTGQTVNGTAGTADADIDAPEAWDLSTGSTAVTVAVIDSGVGTGHPDLVGNLVAGYDFVDADSAPDDLNDHGTHVAGTISAVGNNSAGVVGVNWNVKIMPLRALNAAGSGTIANISSAVTYAASNGAHIINMSLGGTGYSQTFYDAINTARTAGLLVVVAAGNSANNNDGGLHFYPCDYNLDNIICVAATTQGDALASFSNYGTTSVDVAAPGVNIYSTVPLKVFSENFNGATTPGFTGTQFTTSGGGSDYWMTYGSGNVFAYGDTDLYPYRNNANGTLTSSAFDASSYATVALQYHYEFESEYDAGCTKDYMLVQVYTGSVWADVKRYCGSGITGTETLDVTAHKNAAMRVRFQWVTNGSDNNYFGAEIDNVRIILPTTATGTYEFMQGTSMASPQVAGLAALLKSYKSTFTYLGLRNTILNNVDVKAGLATAVATSGRINAMTSLSSADTTPPTATINYSTTAPTNQNVTATLVPNETVVVTNNGGSTTYQFISNGSFQFTFTDLAGNPGTPVTATVNNIDKTAPIITIAPYTTTPTNTDITVTATTNEGTLNAASYTFTANGAFDFVATDVAGNATTSTVTITNIDKTAPIITIGAYNTAQTNVDITVTATTNEGTLNAASHTFTANGAFDFVATDVAGNPATTTVTITNIDKTAPVLTLTGAAVVILKPGQAHTDPGAIAIDDADGDITSSITVTRNLIKTTVGEYKYVYTVTDRAGNTATVTRQVIVAAQSTTLTVTSGAYTATFNGKKRTIRPLGNYAKRVLARKLVVAKSSQPIYVFLPLDATAAPEIIVVNYKGDVLRRTALKTFSTGGFNADTVTDGVYAWMAIGPAASSATARVYRLTATATQSVGSLAQAAKGNVFVKFLKLFSTPGQQYGLATAIKGNSKSIRVWRYSSATKKFTRLTTYDVKKIILGTSGLSLKTGTALIP